MAKFVEDIDLIRGSQDSIEVEIVSDDEFKMLDEAIQNAMVEGRPSLQFSRQFPLLLRCALIV